MKGTEFLFGKKKESGASVSDRISYSAKNTLDKKLIYNPWNNWLLVLFRQYLLLPILKVPLLPIVEAMEVRRFFPAFEGAKEIFKDRGASAKVSYTEPLRKLKQGKGSLGSVLKTFFSRLFWKKNVFINKFDSNRFLACEAMVWEKELCSKLFFSTLMLWILSMVLYGVSFLHLYNEGLAPLQKDWNRVLGNEGLFAVLSSSRSKSFPVWFYSFVIWCFSLFFSYMLSSRPWVKMSIHVRSFLNIVGIGPKTPELESKFVVLALPELIYIVAPGVSDAKIRTINSGWPGNFAPGELLPHQNKQEEIIALRRPEKKPIVFGGDYANASISEHQAAYDQKILPQLKISKKTESERFFLGEVIDPRWWQSSQIFVDIATSPHVFMVGQTRSGKTKSMSSLIYALARSYPDSEWFFADGKSSSDYDPLARYLSIFPVAKPEDKSNDSLVQFANIIEHVWVEKYLKRREAFERASSGGKSCSTIYQYRDHIGEMTQVFLVVDEFGVFSTDMDFQNNWRTEGTLAYRLKKLAAESASYGIHLLFSSQRYQESDMPPVMRSNFTTRFVHNVQQTDADFLKTPEAMQLDRGQFYVTAQGLYCPHTGISKVKAKLPYIGDVLDKLLETTIPPIDPMKKREFDSQLIYNTGSNAIEKMSMGDFSVRLQKYFKDQSYYVEKLIENIEAADVQFEVTKANRYRVKQEDGAYKEHIEKLPGAPAIGVSILHSDEIQDETLITMQEHYSQYSVILVFVLGRPTSSSKIRNLDKINEGATRFQIFYYREYSKEMSRVEMHRKQEKPIDLIAPKLLRLGLSSLNSQGENTDISIKDISTKSPMKLKLSKILEITRLNKNQNDGNIKGSPFVSTIFPGGTEVYFLIASGSREERDSMKDLAISLVDDGKGVVIIYPEKQKFLDRDVKTMEVKRIKLWRSSEIDYVIKNINSKDEAAKFVHNLMKSIGIIYERNGQEAVKINKTAKLRINCDVADETKINGCRLTCDITGYALVNFQSMDMDKYTLENLQIPPSAQLKIRHGMAPLGSSPSLVTIDLMMGGRVYSFVKSDKWTIDKGILVAKQPAKK